MVVKEAVRLKEASRPWLAEGSPETADRYRQARRAAVGVDMGWDAKSKVWEEKILWRITYSWPQDSSGKPFNGSERVWQGLI